ncbi:tetratricopeptide repeat protein [Caulobacter mirabilis]|uniref:Tetratricopeptide repeat protein n=1 Tax=Caulobacter mirabilis TaxID=69666 RepID=A0A2D2AT00_9CAUL|nr:hypothetical protein [Caulobacter mirabilis]ATQ41129.1 hypothetical protein CSW64_01245 [Caulobacter mirabilis]
MTSRSGDHQPKRWVWGAAWGVSLLLGGLALAQGAASILPAAAAVHIAPWSGRWKAELAAQHLAAGDVEGARSLALQALRGEPANVEALRTLGLAAAQAGDPKAERLVSLAAERGFRDGPSHLWMFENRVRARDYPAAFLHADALLRRRLDVRASMFRTVAELARNDPAAKTALIERLETEPSWRSEFFYYLANDGLYAGLADDLALGLNAAGHGLSPDEQTIIYMGLVSQRRLAEVSRLRRGLGGQANSLVVDSAFDGVSEPLPFRWNLFGGVGSAVDLTEDGLRGGNRALRIEYDGYSAPGMVNQLLLLEPGRYELVGQRRSEDDQPIRTGWSIICADDGRMIASESVAPPQHHWARFRLAFEVPAQGCVGQWLQLQAHPLDRRQTIVVWYDDLNVQRAEMKQAF